MSEKSRTDNYNIKDAIEFLEKAENCYEADKVHIYITRAKQIIKNYQKKLKWHYLPEVPKIETQYIIEIEIENIFTKKKEQLFTVEYYFIDPENNRVGWQCHPNGRGIIRWKEIPE